MKQGQLSWFCPELVHVQQVLLVWVIGHWSDYDALLMSHPEDTTYLRSGTAITQLLKNSWPWISLYDPVVLTHIILNLDTTCADNWESPEMYYSCACIVQGFSAIFIDYYNFLLLWFFFFFLELWEERAAAAQWWYQSLWTQIALLRVLVQALFLRKALSMFTSNICAAEPELLSKCLRCISITKDTGQRTKSCLERNSNS